MIRLGRGEWKGHPLRPFPLSCRPTTGLVRGAVLDIAGERLVRSGEVWDLCSGSGALGLEALSMGAPRACFVDRDRRSAVLVSGFLRERGAQGRADVLTGDVARLFPPSGARPVLVFIDPPYRELYLYAWSWSRDWGSILAPEGMVFVESGHDPGLEGWSTRRYGDSYLTWMRKGPG